MNEKNRNIEIDLKRLVLSVVKRAWLIVLVGVLLAVLAFSYARFMITPQYAAEVRLYVNNTYGAGSVGFSSSQMMAAQSLASSYMVLLDSYDVLEQVADVAGVDYSVSQLRGMITTAAIDETEIFRVVVTCENRKHAVKIANAVQDVLPEMVNAVVNGKTEDQQEQETSAAMPLVAVQQAEDKGQVAPNTRQYATIGFLVGAMITMVAVVVRDLLDTSINSEEFLTQSYEDIPLLAVIPDAENPKGSSAYKGYYESQKKRPPVQKGGANG